MDDDGVREVEVTPIGLDKMVWVVWMSGIEVEGARDDAPGPAAPLAVVVFEFTEVPAPGPAVPEF